MPLSKSDSSVFIAGKLTRLRNLRSQIPNAWMPEHGQCKNFAQDMNQKISPLNVGVFVRNDSREVLFTKAWYKIARQHDYRTKNACSDGNVDRCGFKKRDPIRSRS
jgi:hypothetical protein